MVNIFYLDKDPDGCAQYYCDKHVLKIVIEIAQMLCNVHHQITDNKPPYRRCDSIMKGSIPFEWLKKSIENYKYAVDLGLALIKEYKYRYSKSDHKTEPVLLWLKNNPPSQLPKTGRTPYELTHHLELYPFIHKNPVISSRFMYVEIKCKSDKWTKRGKPDWFIKLEEFVEKEKEKYQKKILAQVNEVLPKVAREEGWVVRRSHSFLRVIYDTLLGGQWDKKATKLAQKYDKKRPFLYQLTLPQLYFGYQISRKLKIKKILERLNTCSLKYRKKLEFPQERINYRKNPEYYVYKHTAEGIFTVEPYKSEISPLWCSALSGPTLSQATKSSRRIYAMFLDYIESGDLIGADMARKYLQMGWTRALDKKRPIDKNRLQISELFKKQLDLAKSDKRYQSWIKKQKDGIPYHPDKFMYT